MSAEPLPSSRRCRRAARRGAADRDRAGLQRGAERRPAARRAAGARPGARGRRRLGRLDRPDRRGRRRGRGARRHGSRSTSGSAARSRPASGTPGSAGTSSRCGSTATGSTTRRSSARSSPRSLAGEADIAIGSRFIGNDGYRSSAARRVGIRVLARVVSWIAHERLTDTTSGFQALNRRAIALFAADLPHDYPEVEGLVMAIRQRHPRPRGAGDDARARARPLLDQGARLVLLHGQGAARGVRRPLPPRRRPAGGRR